MFGGVLIIDASSISTNASVLVLATYNNYSGEFRDIQFVNYKPLQCDVLSATPNYGATTFSVLLTHARKAGCTATHHSHLALIVGCVVGGVGLIAVIVAIVLIVFFRDTIIFHRAVKRQYTTDLIT